MRVRRYGDAGPVVVLLHGGPGAPGYMAPVARGLADAFRVVEPFQRGSGDVPLTVAQHVADLQEIMSAQGEPPALLGSSWGAMLALACAAAHPASVARLVLVGCGTFDHAARARLQATIDERCAGALAGSLQQLSAITDADARLRAMAELLLPVYSHDLDCTQLELEGCDARAHDESWNDMLRLQERGDYPAAFAAIEAPVLMIHGAEDPHPGPLIRDSLRPFVAQLEYRELARCGHYPWLERAAREEFFALLRTWLRSRR